MEVSKCEGFWPLLILVLHMKITVMHLLAVMLLKEITQQECKGVPTAVPDNIYCSFSVLYLGQPRV
jgi:hypothetical protein